MNSDKQITLFHLVSSAFALLFVILLSTPVSAQVAVSIGVQGLYDDNVFLEDDEPPITALPSTPSGSSTSVVLPESADGNANDDIITDVHIGISGALPTHSSVKAGYAARVGSLLFSNETEESRLTVDTHLKIESTEGLLHRPFFISLASDLTAGTEDVAVAEGSSTRVSQSHDATLGAGIKNFKIFDKTDLDIEYALQRHDFLGEFLFTSRPEDRFEEEGSDYFSNAIDVVLTNHTTQKLNTEVYTGVEYLKFTNVDSNDFASKSSDDIDRVTLDFGGGVSYVVSNKLSVSARAGGDISLLTEDQESTITSSSDDTETSLVFNAGVDYLPITGTALSAHVDQSTVIDIDGDRILSRTATLSGLHKIGEALQLSASGLFTQYDNDDTLKDPTERFEVTTTIRYFITEAVAIALGWNFTSQDVDDNDATILRFGAGDYESHRAFITLDFGLVGI